MFRSFDGGRLFGAQFGPEGPRVLALPGWGRDHGDFAGVAQGLSVGVLAVDPPGFGRTPPPGDPWTTAGYADAVAPVLDEFALPPIVLGHSFGGRVAVHLAATRPDRVGALVLTGAPLMRDPAAPPGRRTAPAFRLARALHRIGLVSEVRMEKARQRHGSADYRAASGVMRDVLVKAVNEDYATAIAAVRCPVRLVWGDDDTAAPLGGARALEASLTDAQLTVCPGAGHFTPQTAPAALRRAIEELVSEAAA